MNIHKNTKLTPAQRQEIYRAYYQESQRVSDLARDYRVSRPTIYQTLQRGRKQDFSVHDSTNKRYRCLKYGIKRLAKIEQEIEERLKQQAKRYQKDYPGQMVHADTKQLPMLEGHSAQQRKEYLFVAIDDYSRELFAAILPDKTQLSSTVFLEQVQEECAYTIERWYTDNGKEWKGQPTTHAFMQACLEADIDQRFTKVARPQTNGKAERVIRTVMEGWHDQTHFQSRAHRKTALRRFVNYYNTVKPHRSLENRTPMEQLEAYFFPDEL